MAEPKSDEALLETIGDLQRELSEATSNLEMARKLNEELQAQILQLRQQVRQDFLILGGLRRLLDGIIPEGS